MEENLRSGDRSGVFMKKRSSSGCLIVRKKGDVVGDVGSSGSRKGFAVKNERKRSRLPVSDSGSSEEAIPSSMPPRRGVDRVCNGLTVPGKHAAVVGDFTGWNVEEKRKRNKLDVYEFDEYDGSDGEIMLRRKCDDDMIGKRFFDSSSLGRSGGGMEFRSSSNRHFEVAGRKNFNFDRTGSSSIGRKGVVDRMPWNAMRDDYMNDLDKPIRVQGKNGVLKVHVNKKKKLGGSSSDYNQWRTENSWKNNGYDGIARKKAVISSSDEHGYERHKLLLRMEGDRMYRQKFVPSVSNESSEEDLEDSEILLKQRSADATRKNIAVYSSKSEKKKVQI